MPRKPMGPKAATPYERTLAYDERQREAGKVRLSVWVEPEDRQALRDAAEAGGETVGDVIRNMLAITRPVRGKAKK